MRGRGFEPHTERMINTGHGLQLLNMEQQEPIFLLQTDEHSLISQVESEWIFTFHSTRVRAMIAGDCYCLTYRMHPLLPGGTGQTIYILRLGKVGSVLPTHLLNSHEVLGLRAACPTLHSIDARCWGLNPGSLTKSWHFKALYWLQENPR